MYGIIVVYFGDGSHNCSNVKAAGARLLSFLLARYCHFMSLTHKWLLSATAGGDVESASSPEGRCQSAAAFEKLKNHFPGKISVEI